jgi:alkanesulfonate monooxygenase SsuD/methylene tetrahydromethanopterin reductase-like flavin-dependent oxidoreductase (luciferase family)
VKIGIQLPEVEYAASRDEVAAMARAAEEVGFDSLWVGDHLLYRDPVRGPWDAWTTLAWLAGITERIELGPLVACTAFHPPGVLARMAAATHELSGGRLVLGLGCGWNEVEFQAFGLPFDHLVSRFEEAFTIVRTLLRDGRADVDGTYYRVEDCVLDPAPVRPGGPPLMLGSIGPRMLRIGLPYVDAWNVWWSDYGNTPEGFAEVKGRVDEAAADAGRRPGDVAATAAVLVGLPGGGGRVMGENSKPPVRPVQGSPDDIAAHVEAMADAGAEHVQLVVDPITQESIERLADALAVLDR